MRPGSSLGVCCSSEWGRKGGKRVRGHVAALPTPAAAVVGGGCWQEGAENRTASAGPAWNWRPYLVSAVPGARQRAVARARRPVREVPRQLVQDGRGVVLRAGGRQRGHGDWLRALRLGRGTSRPAAPPAATTTSCQAPAAGTWLTPRRCGRGSAGLSCLSSS